MTLIQQLQEKYGDCAEVFYEKAQIRKNLGYAFDNIYDTFMVYLILTCLMSTVVY